MNDHHTRKGERTQMTQIPNEQDVIQSIQQQSQQVTAGQVGCTESEAHK